MSGGGPAAGGVNVQRAGFLTGSLLRRARHSHAFVTACLLSLTVLLGVVCLLASDDIPIAAMTIPLLLGGMLLKFRWLVVLVFVSVGFAAYAMADPSWQGPRIGLGFVVGGTAWIVLAAAKVRTRLGVQGTRGESMLIELRDLLTRQGDLPELPSGWHAEVAVRSAGGASFSGDFVVSATTECDSLLEVALVDVSGKGLDAGTRALLLSGAFGGLLGVVPVEEFLPSANRYLRRQDWDDEFATVVHVAVNLASGDFEVRTAGHPPAIQFDSWAGRWLTREAEGPLLGLLENPAFPSNRGKLRSGDALFLYSDGMVEERRRDIHLGTDRMVGHAERMVATGFENAARVLVHEIGGPTDDSAVVLIHREMNPMAATVPLSEPTGHRLPTALKRRKAALLRQLVAPPTGRLIRRAPST